jgi:hypothetical protein
MEPPEGVSTAQSEFELLSERSESLKGALDAVKLLEQELNFCEKEWKIAPSSVDESAVETIFNKLVDDAVGDIQSKSAAETPVAAPNLESRKNAVAQDTSEDNSEGEGGDIEDTYVEQHEEPEEPEIEVEASWEQKLLAGLQIGLFQTVQMLPAPDGAVQKLFVLNLLHQLASGTLPAELDGHTQPSSAIQLLLSALGGDINVNMRKEDGMTALQVAVHSKQQEAVESLLGNGAKTDICLEILSTTAAPKMVDGSADIDPLARLPPLLIAVKASDITMVRLLLNYNADMEVGNPLDDTITNSLRRASFLLTLSLFLTLSFV